MKKSCLFILFVWIAVAFAYLQLFKGTELESLYWIPVLFGLAAAMIVGNIQGVFMALNQRKAAATPFGQWKDGDFVVVSGRISAIRSPITAPFSGTSSCVVEYEVKLGDTPGGYYSGFLMAPSAVMTNQGSVRLVGFPMLVDLPKEIYIDTDSYKRAGEYFANCKFEKKDGNPLKLISQLSAVLSDDDGEVKADFYDKNMSLHVLEEVEPGEESITLAEQIEIGLEAGGYDLEEIVIKNGDEVTASGTYRQSKQAIDIGSGIKNLTHSLKLGTVNYSTGAMLRNSFVTLIIIGGIFVTANWFVLKEIGIDPNNLISIVADKLN